MAQVDKLVQANADDGWVRHTFQSGCSVSPSYDRHTGAEPAVGWNASLYIQAYSNGVSYDYRRGWIWFNTISSPPPVGAKITKIELLLSYDSGDNQSFNVKPINNPMSAYSPTNSTTNQALFDDIGAATAYANYTFPGGGLRAIDLGSQAIADFISHPTYFAVGIQLTVDDDANTGSPNPRKQMLINSRESGFPNLSPTLRITYYRRRLLGGTY